MDEYYEGISATASASPIFYRYPYSIPRRCFFPFPAKFKEHGTDAATEFTEFEYIDVPNGDPTNVTFFVKVKSESHRELVVKFVDRYGVEAHELLAKEGMAPRLLYCGLLDGENDVRDGASCTKGTIDCGLYLGPLRMVVMESIEYTEGEDPLPEDAREQVKRAIDTLHKEGLVFGICGSQTFCFRMGRRS